MKSYTYKRFKTPKHLKLDLDNIVIKLEKNGCAIPKNPVATRTLSTQLRIPKQNGDIRFAKDKLTNETIIIVNPNKKLVRDKPSTVRFYPKY